MRVESRQRPAPPPAESTARLRAARFGRHLEKAIDASRRGDGTGPSAGRSREVPAGRGGGPFDAPAGRSGAPFHVPASRGGTPMAWAPRPGEAGFGSPAALDPGSSLAVAAGVPLREPDPPEAPPVAAGAGVAAAESLAVEGIRSLAAPDTGAADAARAVLAWATRAAVSAAASRRAVHLSLTTPALGRISLEVRVRGPAVQVGFSAAGEATRHLLAEAGGLADELAGRGLKLAAFLPRSPAGAIL
jgi:hypothetical protein